MRILIFQLDQLSLRRYGTASDPPAEGDGLAVQDVIGSDGEGRGRLHAEGRLGFDWKDRRGALIDEAELLRGPPLHRVYETPVRVGGHRAHHFLGPIDGFLSFQSLRVDEHIRP